MNKDNLLIILASRNAKKIREMQALLDPYGLHVQSVADFPAATEVEEDGTTFAENAAKKAAQIARQTGHWAIGEDSGLCVDALNGAPGIYSARFSGPDATDEANNQLLIEKIQDLPKLKRTAHYVCHAAVANPQGEICLQVERTCRGRILTEARGAGGFGYDPYFLIPEYGKTFGELPAIVKKSISHRARTFQQLIPQLVSLLKAESTSL